MNRKERRRLQKEQERLQKKVWKVMIKSTDEGRPLLEVLSTLGTVPLSFCSQHGPYTYDDLCSCYNAEGKNPSGQTYEENFIATFKHKLKNP
jgi:hypothetical protein|tara:strand:- start:238 stop:513 length:276 start_codon:yes stop_codon:yes gene_type:complete